MRRVSRTSANCWPSKNGARSLRGAKEVDGQHSVRRARLWEAQARRGSHVEILTALSSRTTTPSNCMTPTRSERTPLKVVPPHHDDLCCIAGADHRCRSARKGVNRVSAERLDIQDSFGLCGTARNTHRFPSGSRMPRSPKYIPDGKLPSST